MAADSADRDRESPRRAIDPLVAGVSDGVSMGYDALERVLEGLRQSLRVRARREGAASQDRPPRAASARGAQGTTGAPPAGRSSLEVIDELARLAAEVLDRGGELAQEVAQSIAERPPIARDASRATELELRAAAGARAKVEFRLSNTGASALKESRLIATDLVGNEGRIPADAVSFEPPLVEHLRPGGSTTIVVAVAVPAETPMGTYHGLIHAHPGHASAVLDLAVGKGLDSAGTEASAA